MKTVADLKPGDVVHIDSQPFVVRSVHTSGDKTTLIFEDVPATRERREALKKFASDAGGIAAMVPVQLAQSAPAIDFLNYVDGMGGTEKATDPMQWWACWPESQRHPEGGDACEFYSNPCETENNEEDE